MLKPSQLQGLGQTKHNNEQCLCSCIALHKYPSLHQANWKRSHSANHTISPFKSGIAWCAFTVNLSVHQRRAKWKREKNIVWAVSVKISCQVEHVQNEVICLIKPRLYAVATILFLSASALAFARLIYAVKAQVIVVLQFISNNIQGCMLCCKHRLVQVIVCSILQNGWQWTNVHINYQILCSGLEILRHFLDNSNTSFAKRFKLSIVLLHIKVVIPWSEVLSLVFACYLVIFSSVINLRHHIHTHPKRKPLNSIACQ